MKETSTYPLRLPASALRILRRDGGAPPDPDDALPEEPG